MAGVLAGKGGLGGKDRGAAAMDRIARLGMSERQQELNRLWSVYRCAHYKHRKVDWDGKQATDAFNDEVISTQGFMPPGFVDGSGASLPLKYRKPTAPYALVKVIVDRFTGLLFSEGQHPEIKVDGDPATEDWLRALADSTRIWQQMIQARQYGGSMGSTAIGFQFVNGKPAIEVHDPRWCFPEFDEHGSTTLIKLEKRYRYPKEERDPETGKWETKEYWYRRIIDANSDVLFEPAPVDDGEEPQWQEARRADHNFGFCPIVWVQNIPVQDDVDGDPDCPESVYDMVSSIDSLVSQAQRALIANCDPQLVLTTKAELADVQMGRDRALRVPDGSASFLEITATGPKAALELAEQLRGMALEVAQCVLEHQAVSGGKTATEVERNMQSMFSKADIYREQYGQKAVIPVLEMAWRAAQALSKPRLLPQAPPPPQGLPQAAIAAPGATLGAEAQAPAGGTPPGPGTPPAAPQGAPAAPGMEANDGMLHQFATMTRGVVQLPPRYVKDELGVMQAVERELGTGGTIQLQWPDYIQPSLQDVQIAATAAAAALQGGLIDDETAIGFVAAYFKAEDKNDLVEKVRANGAQQQADLMAQMASANQPENPNPKAAPGALLPAAPQE
jgi:hypothetical protein